MVVALLIGLGFGIAMFALIAAISAPMQRYADRGGVYDGKRQAPLGKQLQVIAIICLGCGLGGGFLLAATDGPDRLRWIACGVFAVTMGAAVLLGRRLGHAARPVRAPAQREIARYTGVQRF